MSAKSPILLTSSPSSTSITSICSPVGGTSSSRRLKWRKHGKCRRPRSYMDRIRSSRTGNLLGRAISRLSRARATRRVANVDEGDQVVPNLNNVDFLVHPHPRDIILPQPRWGFSVLAVIPLTNFPPQHHAPPPSMFPVEDPHQNNLNLMPLFSVTVKSTTIDDDGVMYYIRGNETFQRVYYDYAAKVDLFVHEIMIMNNGSFVDMADTPIGIGIVNGETLFVIAQNPEFNLNTRVKHFYVRDHRTQPLRLKVKGDVNVTLAGLYELWAEVANVNPERLIVSHENQVLTTFHTVIDANIKNEQEVFVLPLENNYNLAP